MSRRMSASGAFSTSARKFIISSVIGGSSVALTFATRPYRRIADGRRKPLARNSAMGARFASGLLRLSYTSSGTRLSKIAFVSLAAMANQAKPLRGVTRRGVAKLAAAVAVGSPTGLWRMSGYPAVQQALRNDYFESLGLPRIDAPAQA